MAKEECTTQRIKSGDTSTLRNRKTFQFEEKTFQTPSTPVSEDKNCQTAGHLSGDDTHSSNGTSAQFSVRGRFSNESPSRVLLMLVVGLSFSTRLYKIAEPAHVWWESFMLICRLWTYYCAISFYFFFTMCHFGVSAGMRRTLERWEVTTSTGPSSLMSILLLEKWDDESGMPLSWWLQGKCSNMMTVDLLYYFADANRSRRLHDWLWWYVSFHEARRQIWKPQLLGDERGMCFPL